MERQTIKRLSVDAFLLIAICIIAALSIENRRLKNRPAVTIEKNGVHHDETLQLDVAWNVQVEAPEQCIDAVKITAVNTTVIYEAPTEIKLTRK